jgi:hypothetical protein
MNQEDKDLRVKTVDERDNKKELKEINGPLSVGDMKPE